MLSEHFNSDALIAMLEEKSCNEMSKEAIGSGLGCFVGVLAARTLAEKNAVRESHSFCTRFCRMGIAAY